VLRFLADYSVAEPARIMDCPEATVKTLTRRGLATFDSKPTSKNSGRYQMSLEPSDVLKRAAATPSRGPDVNTAIRRGALLRRRRYTYITGGAIFILVALSLGATALSRKTTPQPPPPSSRIRRSGFVTYRSHNPVFSIRYPASWYRAPHSLTPRLSSPHGLFSISTRPLRYRRTNCGHLPKSAFQDLSSKDAFISVQESYESRFPKRPADFRAVAHPTRRIDCMPRPRRPIRYYWKLFQDSGRQFYALVVIGTHASATVKNQRWAALNSFSTTTTPRLVRPSPADGYKPVLTPAAGAPGTETTVSGALPQAREGGQFGAPISGLELWWNLEPTKWFDAVARHPLAARPGPVLSLASERVKRSCTYRMHFRIPRVSSGRYPVAILFSSGGGTSSFVPVRFQVLASTPGN
jgi:hypothetical protein